VRETARRTFEEGQAAGGLPTIAVDANQLRKGLQLADLMVATGLVAIEGPRASAVRGGGARVNDAPVTMRRHA